MKVFPYWLIPLFSAIVWLGMLLAMLGYWLAQGRPRLPSMDSTQKIAYISDIGAFELKPLFITGSCFMTIFLDLAIVSERWLRHQGRLAKNTTKSEKVLVVLSLGCALMGTVSLILLTIFDTQNHSRLHRLFLLLYLLGFVLSAVFICAEYQRLGIHFRQFRVLRMSFWIKLAFIIVEVGLAIGFGVCLGTDQFEVGAVLEWVIAFIFTFYILVFLIDLLPATRQKHHRHRPTELTDAEMDAAGASTEPLPMATANARLQDQANGPYGADQHSLRTEQPGRYGTPVDGARPSAARNF